MSKSNELEALLVLENGCVPTKKVFKYLDIEDEDLDDLIADLNERNKKNSVIWVRRREEDVEFFIRSDFHHDFLKHYQQKKGKLKVAALETLSIIAYKQPVTLPEIDEIRGVSCVNQLKFLLTEDLVVTAGKKETAGHPTLFKTSNHFLERFNLQSIKDLPEMEDIKSYALLEESESASG